MRGRVERSSKRVVPPFDDDGLLIFAHGFVSQKDSNYVVVPMTLPLVVCSDRRASHISVYVGQWGWDTLEGPCVWSVASKQNKDVPSTKVVGQKLLDHGNYGKPLLDVL